MARLRLGVVLLLTGRSAIEVAALQRALGARPRAAPHVTLVPPVNVNADRVTEALDLVRAAAAAMAPLELTVGPVATFFPETPVVYLTVGGDLDGLERLRQRVGAGPLDRRVTRPFVPHVTLAEDAAAPVIEGARAALGGYVTGFTAERVHVLRETPADGRSWVPLGDASLGGPRVIGRGGLELEIDVGDVVGPDAAGLLPAPFVVTARREGAVVGAATGRVEADLWLDRLVVDAPVHGQGVGSRLLAEVELLGARRGVRRALTACPPEAEPWFRERGWQPGLPGPGSGLVCLVRALA